MDPLTFLVALLIQSSAPQEPRRVVAGSSPEVKTIYREVKTGEERVEGLLQRVDCPYRRPVTFFVKLKDRVGRYQAPRLDAVEYIAHSADFKGPMTCGGRTPADRVYLTWKSVGNVQRAVAVEFLSRE